MLYCVCNMRSVTTLRLYYSITGVPPSSGNSLFLWGVSSDSHSHQYELISLAYIMVHLSADEIMYFRSPRVYYVLDF